MTKASVLLLPMKCNVWLPLALCLSAEKYLLLQRLQRAKDVGDGNCESPERLTLGTGCFVTVAVKAHKGEEMTWVSSPVGHKLQLMNKECACG